MVVSHQKWLPVSILALAFAAAAWSRPVVFWQSDPIEPGETALLSGDGIGADVTAEGWRVPENGPAPAPQRLSVLQASDISAKVLIPKAWKPGLFAIRLRNASGTSEAVYLNRTEPWWYLAGENHTAAAAGEIRVFGKNFGPLTTAWLETGGRRIPLIVLKAEAYSAGFRAPAATPPGAYKLWVSNGFGGELGRGGPLSIDVVRRVPWPAKKFDVMEFGAAGDGLRDDTDAFRAALAKAEANGGGVVFAPRGRYKISGKLVIPPHTVLRGEKRELVWLFVPKNTPEFDAVLAGNHDFAIEELSLAAQTPIRLIGVPDDPAVYRKPWGMAPPSSRLASNVRLHRLRLQHLQYAHRVGKGDPRRMLDPGFATLALNGDDIELSDSEVISSGMPIATHNTRRLRLERNRLDTGRNGWYGLWNSEETLIEDNIIEGRDLEASYGGFQQKSYRIYYAGNRLQDAYGDEREALTFDTPYAPLWMGRAGAVTAGTFTTRDYAGAEKLWKPGELKGQACLIAYGKGAGEYVPIADNTGNTITLVRPWTVPPDASSHLVIHDNRAEIVITRNHFSDASVAVQLYAQSYGVIIDGNFAERTGGMYGLSWDFWWGPPRNRRRYSTCMFNQWLNNELREGFVYEQGPWTGAVVGPESDAKGHNLDPPAITTLGNIVRRNRVSDHHTIGAFLYGRHPLVPPPPGTAGCLGRDTILEGNTVTGSPVAIDIYPGFRDTLVRNNRVEGCPVPLSDDGVNTWTAPGDRLRMQVAAARERFGSALAWPGQTLAALWKAVAKAAGGPVEERVAAMLAGLHWEAAGTHIRLRTEAWAPPLLASVAESTIELRPAEIGEMPAGGVLKLTLDGTSIEFRLTPAQQGTGK